MMPTTIGRYEIRGELGRGGMAAVFRGYDPRFNRDVAVKVLPREFLHDPNFRARFEREARTIAALEHPAIVPVYDYGEDADLGQPYLVMRLMPGGSLADRLAQGRLDPDEAARILSQLAPALDQAHAKGIVHRDLKPGNILFDSYGNPHIADFGLAKLTESSVNLSASGVLGTPAYLSPEQARGDKEIDGRSDVYAVGAILYQMLTGHQPFEADTPIAMVFKHISEPPPRLSQARPDLPAGYEAVILRAMAKEKADRFPTATSLASTLASHAGLPAPAQTDRTHLASPAAPATRAPAQAASATIVVPARPGNLIWWIGGAGVLIVGLAVVAGGLIALNVFGGGAATEIPTRAASAATSAVLPTDVPAAATVAPTQAPSPTPEPTGTLAAGALSTSEADGMVQVYVPAGEFTMGSQGLAADESPAHPVYLDAFWIDRTEVTNQMYAVCVAAGACPPPDSSSSISRVNYFGNPAFGNFPVVYVSWDDARAYCEWAGRRLPTEAEWEKAARGTDGRLYPWGDSAPDGTLLNYNVIIGDTDAVGRYAGLSPYGALDMAGNAWEWVADWYDPAYYAVSPRDNPTGPAATGCPEGPCRVLRGGGWDSSAADVRASRRLFYGPADSRDGFTFRCARTP